MKTFLLIIAFATSLNCFSQKTESKPLFSLCGKSGNCSMTWDEYKKCSKELTPIAQNLKISSFIVTFRVIPLQGADTVYVDYQNTGNVFSKETSEQIEKLMNEKRIGGNKILIEEVKALQDGKEMKISGMVIKLN